MLRPRKARVQASGAESVRPLWRAGGRSVTQVIDELGRGNRLEFRDFGVFEIKERAPRVAQNPKTLERVQVPARRTVKFKVGRLMRETLAQPEEAVEIVGQINID